MKFLENLKQKNLQLQLEKLIIGVEEPIFIKGLGNILAKVDSGNGAFNVIHGEDFYYQGNNIIFTAYDENDIPHKISKKVHDNITINIGGGHTEDRPVVYFDVKFANDEYKNVPFSIGNRATNKLKVLLGKDFLTKELDVLIDINASDIASKNIEIDTPTINEAQSLLGKGVDVAKRFIPSDKADVTEKNPSGQTTNIGKAAQYAKGAWKGFMALTDKNSKFFGEGGALSNMYKVYKGEIDKIQKSDKDLIFNALNKEFMASGQPIAPFVNNPQVFKILDYFGVDYENKENMPEQSQEPEKQPYSADKPILSDPYERTDFGAEDNSEEEDAENVQDNTKTWAKSVEDAAKENAPILYLVIFNGSQVNSAKELLKSAYPNFKGEFKNLMSDIKNTFYTETSSKLAKSIISLFKEKNILANIALCSGRGTNRQVKFLAQNFQPSLQSAFLLQYCKNYKDELKTSYPYQEIPEGAFDGKFLNNKIFGYREWSKGTTGIGAGMPEDLIEEWLKDTNFHKGFNVKLAFEKFINSHGKSSDFYDEDIPSETKEENDKKPEIEPESPEDEQKNNIFNKVVKDLSFHYKNNKTLKNSIINSFKNLFEENQDQPIKDIINYAKQEGKLNFAVTKVDELPVDKIKVNPKAENIDKEITEIILRALNNEINKLPVSSNNLYKLTTFNIKDLQKPYYEKLNEAIMAFIEKYKNNTADTEETSEKEEPIEDVSDEKEEISPEIENEPDNIIEHNIEDIKNEISKQFIKRPKLKSFILEIIDKEKESLKSAEDIDKAKKDIIEQGKLKYANYLITDKDAKRRITDAIGEDISNIKLAILNIINKSIEEDISLNSLKSDKKYEELNENINRLVKNITAKREKVEKSKKNEKVEKSKKKKKKIEANGTNKKQIINKNGDPLSQLTSGGINLNDSEISNLYDALI